MIPETKQAERQLRWVFFMLALLDFSQGAAYFSAFSLQRTSGIDPCYDDQGQPIRCMPDFVNAAFGMPVVASSECGENGFK